MIPRYGSGLTIITDNATCFNSSEMKAECARIGIRVSHVRSRSPRSNPVERIHGPLKKYIRAHQVEKDLTPGQWPLSLPFALSTLRMSGFTGSPHLNPFLLTFLEPAHLPVDAARSKNKISTGAVSLNLLVDLAERRKELHEQFPLYMQHP